MTTTTHKIKGSLYGSQKTVNVEAASQLEAIRKIKAKYPDFLIDRPDFPALHPANNDETIELLKKIESHTRKTGRVASFITACLCVVFFLVVIAVAYQFSLGI